jgi:AcrR family transcriptional regulator
MEDQTAMKEQVDTMVAERVEAAPGAAARGRNFPELIVTTFLDLMQSRDPNSITFRDIAAAAGISHMAPYRHFRSKQALLDRVADIGFGLLAQALEDAAAHHPHDPRRQIVAACASYYRFAVDHPAHAQVMFGTCRGLWDKALPPPALERTRAVLLRIIHQCQLAGDLPGGRSAKEVLGLLWAHIHGFTLLAANGALTKDDIGAPEAFVDAAVRVVLAGLRAA